MTKRAMQESVVFRQISTFKSGKTRVPLPWITSVFIKLMSPRHLVDEINGEFVHHINVGYQRTHSF